MPGQGGKEHAFVLLSNGKLFFADRIYGRIVLATETSKKTSTSSPTLFSLRSCCSLSEMMTSGNESTKSHPRILHRSCLCCSTSVSHYITIVAFPVPVSQPIIVRWSFNEGVFFKEARPVWWPSWQPWKPKRPMSTQDPSGSPRKWSYVFCALPDRRTPNNKRPSNDRCHDPSRCPTCRRWNGPTSVAARYCDDVPATDRRSASATSRPRIFAGTLSRPVRRGVVAAGRCSAVGPSS